MSEDDRASFIRVSPGVQRWSAVPSTSALAVLGGAALAAAGLGAYAAPSLLRATPPWLIPHLIPDLAGIGDPGHVALTFDDGPDPRSTPAVLAALDELGWRATFFCLGTMAEAAPTLLKEMEAGGHEIGVHGYSHDGAIRRRPSDLCEDVVQARDIIGDAIGVAPWWYRPPYGELSLGTWVKRRKAELRLVLWTAWGPGLASGSHAGHRGRRYHQGASSPGGTILLHDSGLHRAHRAAGAPPLPPSPARRAHSMGSGCGSGR